MADTAKLKIGDNSYEFPLIKGSENELAIDIKRRKTKVIIRIRNQ